MVKKERNEEFQEEQKQKAVKSTVSDIITKLEIDKRKTHKPEYKEELAQVL